MPWQPLQNHLSQNKKGRWCCRRQRKCWINNIKEWTSLPMPELNCWIIPHLLPPPPPPNNPTGQGTELSTLYACFGKSFNLSTVLWSENELIFEVGWERIICIRKVALNGFCFDCLTGVFGSESFQYCAVSNWFFSTTQMIWAGWSSFLPNKFSFLKSYGIGKETSLNLFTFQWRNWVH